MAVNEEKQIRFDLPDSHSDNDERFVKFILRRFTKISAMRFFKLSFLSEYYHLLNGGDRLTSAEYRVVMGGVYSAELDSAIEAIDEIERTHVLISGERILTLSITEDFDVKLEDDDAVDRVNSVIDEYGTVPPDEIDGAIQDLPVYQRAKLGEILKIDEYVEEIS